MTTATSNALERNAATATTDERFAPPPNNPTTATAAANDEPKRPRWNLKQESLAREFVDAYGISRDQISFDGDSDTPWFHFEALATIVTALTKFKDITISQAEIDHEHGSATSNCVITLEDGRTVSNFGSCFAFETLPGEQMVGDLPTAVDVSRARALRNALRMIGFDPVRAHEAAKRGQQPDAPPTLAAEEEQRRKELAEIHMLAPDAGLIVDGDDTKYRRMIAAYFDGLTSAGQMNQQQRAQFIALLRALKSARERGVMQ